MWIVWVGYFLMIVCALIVTYFMFLGLEYFYCVFFKHQVPFVSSSHRLRVAVAKQINDFYPDAKCAVEVGSGHGGLARYVARHTKLSVLALENMPFCIFMSRIGDLFCRAKSKTVWCDAFKFLDEYDGNIDIAIAYLGPKLTPMLKKYNKKIKVLIAMDFEIHDLVPVRVVDLKRGYVVYNGVKYPHKLFVYEFK
ncbi:MAG: hypothetical protein J6K82_02600 [Alphaproteobacteria bacterium]|nr:hypothetical protein [Alphaproteobacteria bacterium]